MKAAMLVTLLALPFSTAYADTPSVAPAILSGSELSWERVDENTKRRVFVNQNETLAVYEISGGVRSHEIKTHTHPQDQISYILEGQAEVHVGALTRIVGPGSAYIVPANVPHGMRILTKDYKVIEVFSPGRADLKQTGKE